MKDAPERIYLDGDVEAGDGIFPRCFESPKYASEPQVEYIRADLATPMRCAECDCEKGGADCNWIATPTPLDDPRVKALVEAGKAVVDRGDSPLWKDLPHTGESIADLRAALSALEENK